jgi:hypothetical protein
VGVADRWAALQFDSAVVALGTLIENAAQEQVNVGGETSPKWQAKYTLRQLLTPGFVIGQEEDDALVDGVDGLVYDEIG